MAAAIDRYSTRWGGWEGKEGRHMTGVVIVVVIAGIVVLAVLALVSLAVLREYERGVVFRMGHVRALYRPGLRFLIPLWTR